MRKPVIIGNWKMNKTLDEAKILISNILSQKLDNSVEKVVCVPYIYVTEIKKLIDGTGIGLGVQNMFYENSGAYTGEISPTMLKSCGVSYVILGHSERRTIFNETDDLINKKVKAALQNNIIPILCCGETLDERNSGVEKNVVKRQISNSLFGICKSEIEKVIIAYEPIWAIGTGKTATTEQAQEVCKAIRVCIEELYGSAVSEVIRIQYGGSVGAANAAELFAQADIDGGLVGGASLKPDFGKIVNYK